MFSLQIYVISYVEKNSWFIHLNENTCQLFSTLRLICQEPQSTNSIKLFISILPYPGKGQFSFQSQRKAMPKNVQTTTQLHSSHTLAK